jgi:hypothetical protein
LHGLKAVLLEQARGRGVTPSDLVRRLLTEALGDAQRSVVLLASVPTQTGRVRLSLRMTAAQARSTLAAARSAGLPIGAFIAGLVAGIPVPSGGAMRSPRSSSASGTGRSTTGSSRNSGHAQGNRIAVRFANEWHDDAGSWFRSYGNENWEFDERGYMRRRIARINDLPIAVSERKYHWSLGSRPDDYPGLSAMGL